MKKVSNSYFQAFLEATCDGLFPKYSDFWRCYHKTALMLESDYCYFDDKPDSILTTRNEEEKSFRFEHEKLYVLVTRKVTATDDSRVLSNSCRF